MHRDVSTGNFIIHGGIVKLMDLEYIREIDPKIGPPTSDEMKTVSSFTRQLSMRLDIFQGTAQFMPNEIQFGRYLFRTVPLDVPDYPDDRQRAISERAAKRLKLELNLPVIYNTVHDIESCFWILLWFFLHHVPDDKGVYDTHVQEQHALAIFPVGQGPLRLSSEREHILKNSSIILLLIESAPAKFRGADDYMQPLAENICLEHEFIQKALPGIQKQAGRDFYETTIHLINSLAALNPLSSQRVKFYGSTMLKRAHADEAFHRPSSFTDVALPI